MFARQSQFESELFGNDIKKILPIIHDDGSDSAKFDETLEFLYLSGRSLPHAMMMMIPEPWSQHETMSDAKKAFYEYHSTMMEPWDGPASIVFTDGAVVGAVLDRNGLRPSRYCVTKDGMVRDGFGGRRPADGTRTSPVEVAPRAGPDVPRRYERGPHHLR